MKLGTCFYIRLNNLLYNNSSATVLSQACIYRSQLYLHAVLYVQQFQSGLALLCVSMNNLHALKLPFMLWSHLQCIHLKTSQPMSQPHHLQVSSCFTVPVIAHFHCRYTGSWFNCMLCYVPLLCARVFTLHSYVMWYMCLWQLYVFSV